MISNVNLIYQLFLLLLSSIFIQSQNYSYNDYTSQYNFIFKNYKSPNQQIVVKTITLIENLFDFQLFEHRGSIKMFVYTCYYWYDPNLPSWENLPQYKLKYFTFTYREKKCPLKVPIINKSVPNTHITIKNNGQVTMCPHATFKLTCLHTDNVKKSLSSYSCMHYAYVYDERNYKVQCGSWEDWSNPTNKTNFEKCYSTNKNFYSEFKLKSSEWRVSNISKYPYRNDSVVILMIDLVSTKQMYYINKVIFAITLGVISSSILLIPFNNKGKILISSLFLFSMNIWLRYCLSEDASIQYGHGENLMRYFQFIYSIQLIVLIISTFSSLLTSKFYQEISPPEIIVKFYTYLQFLGRIDSQLKKEISFKNGFDKSLKTDVKSDDTKQLQHSIDALKIGWPEITLVMDRSVFIILAITIIGFSIYFL